MAIIKDKLEAYLNKLPLLKEEKLMWYRIGFYISAAPTDKDKYGSPMHTWYDCAGNERSFNANFSTNIRQVVLEWWQAEKSKPRAKELGKQVEVTPYDELEVERG